MKDEQNQEEFLGELQRVLREREEEFQKRERVYREKNEKLQELLVRLSEQKKEQEALFLKQSLGLEKVRNEEIRLKRLAEEYEYRLSILDEAAPKETGWIGKAEREAEEADRTGKAEREAKETGWIGKAEHEEVCPGIEYSCCASDAVMREEENYGENEQSASARKWISPEEQEKWSEEYQKKIAGYEEELASLREERTRLMKHILEAGEGTVQELPERELTAEGFCAYLQKNEPGFASAVIYHSEAGEQVHAEVRGLAYRFLFSAPSYFDIVASRKDSRIFGDCCSR